MTSKFKPECLPVLIGSIPLENHQEASDMVFEHTRQIPIWVQLPAFKEEGMINQFVPGLPGLVTQNDKTCIDLSAPGFDEALTDFYQDYINATEENKSLSDTRFCLSDKYAKGFMTFISNIEKHLNQLHALKGQITGPFTFTTSVHDQNKRAIYYDDRLRDCAVKLIALKAKWQVQMMSGFNLPMIIFFDEPALAGFGSSEFISISKEEICVCLEEVFDAIRDEGALTGVHVCANTDWSLLLDSTVDIINFDAYGYFDRFILYQHQIKKFIDDGRLLAWGIVPTGKAEDIRKETVDSLFDRFLAQVDQTVKLGIDRQVLLKQTFITPSCGTGSLSVADAKRVLEVTEQLSQQVRRHFNLD